MIHGRFIDVKHEDAGDSRNSDLKLDWSEPMQNPFLRNLGWCSSFFLAVVFAGCTMGPTRLSVGSNAGKVPIRYEYGPWSTPENLGSVVNTTANDQHPGISPDGLSLYFHSNRAGNVTGSKTGTTDIWVAHRETVGSAFGPAINLGPTFNSIASDTAPNISSDGHYLAFGSDRDGGCGGFDIWISHRADTSVDIGDGGWEPPINMGCTINSAVPEDGPFLLTNPDTGKVTLYFCAQNRTGGLGDWDVWMSELKPNGNWSDPVNVAELNTAARDTRTAFRNDGLEMYITSMRAGSVPDATGAPSLDLWVSTRQRRQDPWGMPSNLDTNINTASGDGAPVLSPDGTEMFFYSNKPGGFGGNDLYVTHRSRTQIFPPTARQ